MSNDNEELKPSKQQQKREAEAVQALGAEIVALSSAQLTTLVEQVELPDKLREALLASRSITAREARRRQLQYIGKLMRDIDIEPIQQQLAQIKRGGQVATAQLHQIEHWRERLLTESDAAIHEFLQNYPMADAVQIQQLISSAHKETAQQQPPRASRMLFKYMRALLTS